MIEVKNKKEFLKKLPHALWKRENIVWSGVHVLNFIEETVYLDIEVIRWLSIEELEKVKDILG